MATTEPNRTQGDGAMKDVQTHYGHFDGSMNKKYAITVDGKLLYSEDGYGHDRCLTWTTKSGVEKAAESLR